jgi:hypothetical protein
MMIYNDFRPSPETIRSLCLPEKKKILIIPQRFALASDPFYSSVKSSKPVIPNPQIQGPRPQPPLYIHKARLGYAELRCWRACADGGWTWRLLSEAIVDNFVLE